MAETAPAAALPLDDRGIVAINGADARSFLQGLVSNDVDRVAPDRAIWAALLTPQGKFLHDFFVAELDGALVLDCEAARRSDLIRRLSMFKLRSDVALADRTDARAVFALFGPGALRRLDLPATPGAAAAFGGGVVFADPRHPNLGARAILPRAGAAEVLAGAGFAGELAGAGFAAGAQDDYERLRIGLGLPDGSRDMVVEKAILLENGFDELGGVDWRKGCYMGQELTARTRYRGLIKKRLVPVRVTGPLPAPGTPVTLDGREVGEIRSGVDGAALALLRREALSGDGGLRAGDAEIAPAVPGWLQLPA